MLTSTLRNIPRRLIQASAVFFVISFFPVYLPDFPGSNAASYLATIFIALPAVLALFWYLGLRRAGLSLLALAAFAYAIETVGVVTGFPYGTFHYGDALGPKALGLVPYLLPVSYLPLVIGAVAAAWGPWRGAWGRVLHVFGAALLLTLMDGVLDPGAAALGFWVWEGGGIYYGVPSGNYLGWLLSGALAAAIALSRRTLEKSRRSPRLLDSAIIAVAFWTGVAVFCPALPCRPCSGFCLFAYLLYRAVHGSRRPNVTLSGRRRV